MSLPSKPVVLTYTELLDRWEEFYGQRPTRSYVLNLFLTKKISTATSENDLVKWAAALKEVSSGEPPPTPNMEDQLFTIASVEKYEGECPPANLPEVDVEKLQQKISSLERENRKLKSELAKQRTLSHPCLDESRDDYAPELALTLRMWECLYLDAEKQEHIPHSASADRWLKKHAPAGLGGNARTRIRVACNPAETKSDGNRNKKVPG